MKAISLSRILAVAGLLLALIGVSAAGTAYAADPTPGPAPVPIAERASLSISPAKQVQYVKAGQSYAYYYKVTNSGTVPVTAKILTANEQGWETAANVAEVTIAPNSSAVVVVKVAVPAITKGTGNMVKVQAIAADNSQVTAYLSLQQPTALP